MQIDPTTPASESNEPARVIDEHTEQRIREHLSNKNDVISEDDIRNIVTTISVPDEHAGDTPADEAEPDPVF